MATQSPQPQSLEELYNQVGAENTATLKQAAAAIRSAAKINRAVILEAHDLLAGKGREGRFKQWCEWEHVSYGAARWQVWAARREAKEVLGPNTSKGKKDKSLNRVLSFATELDAKEFDKRTEKFVRDNLYTREGAVLAGLRLLERQVEARAMAEMGAKIEAAAQKQQAAEAVAEPEAEPAAVNA